MKVSRTTALAALVVVALAAPVAAFALDDTDQGTKQRSSHVAKAKDDKGPRHATGRERAEKASAAGRAHAEAMKAWTDCVADAASGPKDDDRTGPPKEACGDKPMGPGRAKHEADSQRQSPPGLDKDHPRGKSGAHRSH